MMKQNFTRVAGLLAMLTGAALATGQEDKNALEPDVTVTATFFHTTLTITDWPASIPTPGPPAPNPTGVVAARVQQDENDLEPDVTVTATFFHTTLTITDWPASIPTPGPPAPNPTGVVAADVQQDKNASPELTVTATFGDIIYTITDWPSTIPTPDITVPPKDAAVQTTGVVAADVQQDKNASPDLTVTATFGETIYTITDWPSTIPTPDITLPPKEAAIQATETETPVVDARDIEERDYVTTSSYMDTTTQTWVVPATTLSGPSSTVTFSAITWTNTWTRLVTTHITLPGEPPKTTMDTVVTTATPSKRHGSSFPPHSQVTQAN